MNIKEVFQSIFDSSNERIKSPFIGSYITAFVIYNWRAFFLLIFSEAKIEDKIVVINHEYCNREAILWPLGIALFYIMVLPHLNLIFDKLLSYSNKMKDEREKMGEIKKLQQKKSVAKLEREIAEERAGTSEISELKNQIERLNTENQNILEQSKETFERYNQTTEIAQLTEKELKEKIRILEKDKNSFAPNQLSDAERKYFITYGNYKNGKTSSLKLDYEKIKAFEKYDLIEKINGEKDVPMLSAFGKIFHEYLTK